MQRGRPLAEDLLETAPLTDGVRALARRGELCRFAKGAVLIQEGAIGDTLFVILDGRLRVYGSHLANEREITYGTYGPGEYVGEMGLDGGPRAANVMALVPTVCSMVTEDRPTFVTFSVKVSRSPKNDGFEKLQVRCTVGVPQRSFQMISCQG